MSHKTYLITKNQIIIIKKIIKNPAILEKINTSINHSPATAYFKYTLELSHDEVTIIIDALVFLLTLNGLQQNSEPNALGITIEELIDIFS